MAEAVFTITADITPQIDERQLQRQAEQLAGQLNGILAKKINPVGFNPVTGNFRPFEKEVDKAKDVLDRFQGSLRSIPRGISDLGRAGRNGFLKFTDAINVTRREMVGFGRGIRDSIRATNLFEDALDNIKSAGSSLSDLPTRFEDLAAQVRSGTSVIDQMASRGNQMAQLFQPLQQQGEAARAEFVELNSSIDQLTQVVTRFAAASGKSVDVTRDDFDLLGTSINNLEKPFFRVQALLNATGQSSSTLGKQLRATFQSAAGDPEKLVEGLVLLRDKSHELARPLGIIKQLFGEVTKEERAAAKAARLEFNASLIEMGQGDKVVGLQNIITRIALARQGMKDFVDSLNRVRTGLANILPGTSPIGKLVDSAADAVTFFKVLRTEGIPPLQALRQAFNEASAQFKNAAGITSGLQKIKSELAGLGLVISQTKLGAKINESLGQVGTFLNKNLIGPLKAAGPQVRQAFSGIGRDFANGFGVGIASGQASVLDRAKKMGQSALNALRTVLKSHSDSKETVKTGVDTALGYAHGIQSKQGVVNKAISQLAEGLKALGAEVAQFGKSVAAVAGASLAGLGAVALKTGLDFNVLKQVINSSLPVLVGSKQASAELLIEVNKLNDASPFARSSFLELTRVLAGFGVQAEKITPLIDAIQQTVAATGGSDQDLLELGQAFAKIQSQGRVTGEILQSFSVRGVDAVAVLAKGFEKTSTEMRKMISDGLVPANKAIDILTKGLKEKFDGATDAVAKNFPGALQRVQARLRDIGGTLLTAFVNPEGGGALVDFLNNMADLLSHINKVILPQFAPLLQKAADALVVISEKAEAFVKTMDRFDTMEFIDGLKPWLPLLAALAGLIPAAFGFIPVIGPIIAGLGGPFTAAAAGIAVFLAQSGQLGPVVEGAGSGLSKLKEIATSVGSFIKDNFAGVVAGLLGLSQTIGHVIAAIAGGLGRLVAIIPGLGGVGKALGFTGAAVGGFASKFGNLTPITTKLVGLFPKLAGVLKIFTGPIGILIGLFVQLVLTSQKFREALARLFNAVKPVLAIIGGAFAVAIKIMNEAMKAAEPIFVAIVNVLAAVFEKLKPVTEAIAGFLKKLAEGDKIEKFFQAVKESIATVVDVVVGAINILIKAYNAIPFLDNVSEIKFSIDIDSDPLKKAADDVKKKLEEQAKVAKKATEAIEDAYNAATKAVESAEKAMGDANDQLIQAINTSAGVIQGIISGAKAVQTAQAQIADARTKAAEATKDVSDLEKEYARALQDTIKPTDELGVAERNLTRIRKGLIGLGREEADLAKENKKLREELTQLEGQGAATDRAALARAEERAQISLNKAKQAELDLLNELNGANKVQIDLSGLSIDQIRAKLAGARATASAVGRDRKQTAQEIADSKRSAALDVDDAQAGLDSATKARADFEIDTNEKIDEIKVKIRDNDERILEIGDDRADQLLDEQDALKDIQRLREGENTLAKVTLDFDEKIRDAKVIQQGASEAIKTATQAAQIAQAEYAVKIAEASGKADALYTAQNNLNNLLMQGSGLNFQAGVLRDIMDKQRQNVEAARNAAREMVEELKKANSELAKNTAIQGVGTALGGFESTENAFNRATETGKEGVSDRIFPKIEPAKNAAIGALRSALASGAALQKNKNFEPWSPNSSQIEAVIRKVLELAIKIPLRDAMSQALNAFHLSLTGIAAAKGLSPGMIHPGKHDGKGLVRMFEFGKEAVLPLTRPSDMKKIVNDPSVLPAILNALDLQGFASGTTGGSVESAKIAILQEKLLASRKAALQVAVAAEDAQIGEATAAREALMLARERVAEQQKLNVELTMSEDLLKKALFAGSTAGGSNIVNNELTSPTSKLRSVLQEVFKKLGLQFPGFSTGYAPGDLVQSGLNNGVGMARMFEYGREAVLPLTRPFDLARVVRSPSVLPAILNALPRWSSPESGLGVEPSIVSDLSTAVRSARMGGGPANASVYEKKSQREFASTIGSAVKQAVMEAIAESDGLGGDDIDIHVNPNATETQRAIAREVKRQLDKRTGKW